MRVGTGTATLWMALLAVPGLARAQAGATLTVKAYVSTAGPYGESWELNLAPEGTLSLEIRYMLNPLGKMSGEFIPLPERIKRLQEVIVAEQFMELPQEIWPDTAPLHQPDLRLTVTLGDRMHKVELYDPDQLRGDTRVPRFFAVWKEVFALVPLAPKW